MFHPPTRSHFAGDTAVNTDRHRLGADGSCCAGGVTLCEGKLRSMHKWACGQFGHTVEFQKVLDVFV
jgi:hypothetical protein